MAYIPRSSFAQADAIPAQIKKKQTIHVVGFIGAFMLSCSIMAVVGAFLYKGYLQNQLGSLKENLNAMNHSDTNQKLLEIKKYDHKLNVAHTLLDNHISISELFNKIGVSTKQTVRFKQLEYTYDPGFEAELKLRGDAKELESVALQKMQFIKDSVFSDFTVRDISLALLSSNDPTSNAGVKTTPASPDIGSEGVGFEVAGLFEKDALAYSGENAVQISNNQTLTPQNDGLNAIPVVDNGESDSDIVPTPITNDSNDENI